MEEKKVMEIPIDSIVPNPYQPRRVFSQSALEELSESIKVYGILQPITVRNKGNDEYELVAGERRLRASKLAGRATIPAIINNMSDESSAVLIVSNPEGIDTRRKQKSRLSQALINAERPVTFPFSTGKIEHRTVHTGNACANNAEQYSLQQKAAKALSLPEDDLRNKINAAAAKHRLSIAYPISSPSPGNFQADGQPQANAFNHRNMKNAKPCGLAIQCGHRRIEHHPLQ